MVDARKCARNHEDGKSSEPLSDPGDDALINPKSKKVRFIDPEASAAVPSDRTLRSHSAMDVSTIPDLSSSFEKHSSLSALTAKLTVKKALEGEDSEPLARVCAVGPGCKQAENRNKENPKKRWEFQGRIRYNPAGMQGG